MPVNALSENFLFDTLSALSLMIAFYYALTGLACVIFYRRELTKSVKNFLFIGVGPLVGAVILGFLFVKSAHRPVGRGELVLRCSRSSGWASRS